MSAPKFTVSSRLANDDLIPTKDKSWGWYSIFAFWMSDIHSVGGYVVAASLFALGLTAWQVLISLTAGILIVLLFANLMGKPGQKAGIPFPVVCRMSFGVIGANIPAVIRGLIAVVWYGIQTYLASSCLIVMILYFAPEYQTYTEISFLGLSYLGWFAFITMWLIQASVFMFGMSAIKKLVDWSGPAIYLAMILLTVWMVYKAGWQNINLNLSDKQLSGSDAIIQMIMATAIIAGYFAGPTLNFSDFSRYSPSYKSLKLGNLLGLPLNFIIFSVISVLIVASTIPVFGEIITDPIETVNRLDNGTVIILGSFTFILATVGINIVANFVAPAFDFSNVSPQRISFKTGGFIAAIGGILITPWNLFNNPEVIHYTVDVLAAMIGPIYGIVLIDYFKVRNQEIDIDSLYTEDRRGKYWYFNGINSNAVKALIPSTLFALACSFVFTDLANFSLFIGGFTASISYYWLMKDKLTSVVKTERAVS
ncbi:NCS1 family nucleobase:cation symporter-1 [Vibrio sp. CK2-1]|uniref:NCS1 family nucleobase:cation symporter-1 n=1 Tax=Vibrio sp. CK2-1 TaxID=2912249 RepID=UPI001F252DB3|nr:NCS1 family nucleobase:cation symporter-1 [Vibrio sp. CK2-1]MCF7355553.1 NCS1 family nucleobase:cation symporter-1 [Vibrio sp. CK2-1]